MSNIFKKLKNWTFDVLGFVFFVLLEAIFAFFMTSPRKSSFFIEYFADNVSI